MPDLFKELRARYPGSTPSAGSLSSYLSRENFAAAAIGPAAKAYLETCHYLQRERAYESGGDAADEGAESSGTLALQDSPAMHTATAQPPAPTFLATAAAAARAFDSGPVSAPRRDVFTIGDDGEVVVTLPSTMTQQTYDDLKDWLDLIGRKAQRKVTAAQPQPQPPTDVPDDLGGLLG